ncbi:mechanosensitive ion channel domain-containing protein [Sediminitomix flava]|uniref:Mechanosensitive ion channel-like protein n=1 Tax=Sediminitomix flava TaxID=379075 RepID=A0A315ZTL1_SEDFL|nr:mechanosensitive ion channel-like protein [Sediminitomix flava]
MISVIWGVDQSELVVFLGSVLTIIGVAFFAQWSLLSNITSSIILFFSHPIRLNDSITILEGKEYELEGKVIDIGLFFVTVLTDEGDEIILPNNIFIQKSIKKRKV